MLWYVINSYVETTHTKKGQDLKGEGESDLGWGGSRREKGKYEQGEKGVEEKKVQIN